MNTEIREWGKIKKQILDFTTRSVEDFLKENSDLEFYSFAFDCNAEYAELGLSFNTETSFQKTLKSYQTGEFSQYYKSEEDIRELKYNTGDWDYLYFDSLDVFSNDELDKIFNEFPEDDYKSWNEFVSNLLNLFTECLIEFTKTETYAKIPKTKDFICFCIDHDEDFDDAMERIEKYNYSTATDVNSHQQKKQGNVLDFQSSKSYLALKLMRISGFSFKIKSTAG